LFVDTLTGNVGVGTTEPTESLDIVGNLNLQKVSNTASIKLNSNVVTEYTRSKKLIKYPRVNMTAASGESSGYQGYYVTESSNSADTNRHSWKAFEGTTDNSTSDNAWAPDQTTTTYSGTDNAYNGSLNLGTGAVNGEWIKLQLPNKIKLEYMKIWLKDNDSTRIPEDWRLYGSNDDTNWTELFSKTGQGAVNENLYTINATSMYKYLAVVVTKISGQNDYFRIVELEYFGIPEYDPDADGTDVIVRSAPNVPNTDWLEVYWDGQDYTSMPPTVTDKSANGVTGTPTGDVGFDAEYKAFTFDGSEDYILGQLTSFGGEQTLTFSLWFNMLGPVSGSNNNIFQIGKQGSNEEGLGFRANSSNGSEEFRMYTWGGSNNIAGGTVLPNTWYHVVGIYLDGKMTLYVDGHVLVSSTGSSLNLPTDPYVALGVQLTSTGTVYSTSSFNGSVANLRLFNRAITADEVWQLYAYQKEYFGHGNLDMTLKAGRLGIGTFEPRAVLDVNGTLHAHGVPVQFVSAQVHDKVAYSTAESIHISPLDISITPHFSNSKIYLMWRIEHEVHHDTNLRIYRDGTLIGYNTVSGDVQWSGVTTGNYDQNVDSTPEQSMITWIDEPNTTSTVTYKVYMKRSGNSNWPFYLNRPSVSSGASAQETGVSQKTAMEIAQ